MILDALIAQFQQRFDYEKRAHVCLWFDEKHEFAGVLPALRAKLEPGPAPFHLLEYDADAQHGQIWTKHQIYKHVSRLPKEHPNQPRFVIYVPLSEDRLDSPDEHGQHHLELFFEYRITGLVWRIGGKRPSLFSFLRQAGVRLPEGPSEQRRLWEGGKDSLLAKYVAKFVDRPEAFRDVILTPELVQSKLVGDADQRILDLAVAPEATWQELQQSGLSSEFLDAVRERYGFGLSADDPCTWVREFVTTLALTEAYLGYGQPADFPFMDRLPPAPLRAHHVQFLQRWLRDAESRPAWDRWIGEVEERINLSNWAAGRDGLSFAFPHLVKLRWDATVQAFEQAAGKVSEVEAFYATKGDLVRRECEFARASHLRLGAWCVFEALGRFVTSCRLIVKRIGNIDTVAALTHLYVHEAYRIDADHLTIRRHALEEDLPAVSHVADRSYGEYANALNHKFVDLVTSQGDLKIDGVEPVTLRLDQALWRAKGKRAVVIVDALRFDCAHEIKAGLPEQNVTIEPMCATLPTVTPIGMTALMPVLGAEITCDVQGNAIRPKLNGKDMAQRQNRLDYLRAFGADCRDVDAIEGATAPPQEAGDLLVVYGHEDVDNIGHGDSAALIRHLDVEIRRLTRLIRKLHRWGYLSVHVVTDHGFVLLDEDRLPPEVACNKAWCHVLKERFALVPATADVPLPTLAFAYDKDVRVAVPPGMAFFKAEKSFSHGGATLQEVIIPHLISRVGAAPAKRVSVEVVLPTYTLMQSAVKVVLRGKSEGAPSAPQMSLPFGDGGRTLSLNVFRTDTSGARQSALAEGRPKEIQLNATDKQEAAVTLFFHTALRFEQGELLTLEIRDTETDEQFPAGGIMLTVGRTM